MLKKALALAALSTVLVLQAAPRKAEAANCYEECRDSYQTCPVQCQVSQEDCYQGYQVCMNACTLYNQAWLIC